MRCTIPFVNSTLRIARALNDPYGSDELKLYSTDSKGSWRSVRIERTEFPFSGSLQCGCIGHDWRRSAVYMVCVLGWPRARMSISSANVFLGLGSMGSMQEPITRSLQLPHIPVTAFSQTGLFLVWIYLEFRSPQEPQWPIAITSTD